jgi:hypothetical protein
VVAWRDVVAPHHGWRNECCRAACMMQSAAMRTASGSCELSATELATAVARAAASAGSGVSVIGVPRSSIEPRGHNKLRARLMSLKST